MPLISLLIALMLFRRPADPHDRADDAASDEALSDEELARRLQNGDESALAPLLARHYDALTGYLYRQTGGDRMLSEDLVQETFLRALRGIGGYTYPRRFKPWLYAIATNLVRNHWRAADTRRTVTNVEAATESGAHITSPEGALLADAEAQALLAALGSLPEHQRDVILLRYTQDMSLAEIAKTLGIPVGTVKSRLSLSLKRLRAALEAGEESS